MTKVFGVESVMHVNADSLLTRSDTTSTSGTLNDLRTDLIMANNNCKVVNNLRYPDETVILKEEKEQLQELISANSSPLYFHMRNRHATPPSMEKGWSNSSHLSTWEVYSPLLQDTSRSKQG